MALDLIGGPNWCHTKTYDAYRTSAVNVNVTANEYYKSSMFYVMGHFSKFIPPNSIKIDSTQLDSIESVALQRPDGAILLVVLNKNDHAISFNIEDPKFGKVATKISPRAVQTYIWWN